MFPLDASLISRYFDPLPAPIEKMADLLRKTAAEAKAVVSKDKAKARQCLTQKEIDDAISSVKGAVMIVYPMGLPPYEEVRHILEGTENLAGRQASKEVIPDGAAQLWWAGKEVSCALWINDMAVLLSVGRVCS